MTPIFVSGAIANKPFNGGDAWTRLSYVFGLRKLGYDVYLVEQLNPAAGIDAHGDPGSPESAVNVGYFNQLLSDFGLQKRASLISTELKSLAGLPLEELLDIAGSAELLVNISGHLQLEPLFQRFKRTAYIDLDPGFTQAWHAGAAGGFRLKHHDYYFTVGENVGTPDCPIECNGIRWRRTRPPVVLEHWPISDQAEPRRFTTISNWRGPFGPVNCGGRMLGSKVREFRKVAMLPTQSDATFEIALNIHPADEKDKEMLTRNRWRLVDPRETVPDPLSFRKYVQTSGAEFSVAQEIYVATNSGWFSDRTVRYLASGKPALIQETGFSRNYPVGSGLLAFSTPEEALAGVRSIHENYSAHAKAARALAKEYFDSERVLKDLLAEVV
jgi:hypothetical protein